MVWGELRFAHFYLNCTRGLIQLHSLLFESALILWRLLLAGSVRPRPGRTVAQGGWSLSPLDISRHQQDRHPGSARNWTGSRLQRCCTTKRLPKQHDSETGQDDLAAYGMTKHDFSTGDKAANYYYGEGTHAERPVQPDANCVRAPRCSRLTHFHTHTHIPHSPVQYRTSLLRVQCPRFPPAAPWTRLWRPPTQRAARYTRPPERSRACGRGVSLFAVTVTTEALGRAQLVWRLPLGHLG